MGKPVAPSFDQDTFRVRDNVTDPSGVDAAFDAGDSAANTNWTQAVNTLFRVRWLIQQTNAAATSHSNMATEFLLQYNNTTQATGWVTVGADGGGTEDVEFDNCTGFADGDNTTTARLGSGTLVTGDGLEANTSDTITFTDEALTETELEVALLINGSAVANNDSIQLRWLYSDSDASPPATPLEAYTNTPTITVSKSGSFTQQCDATVAAVGTLIKKTSTTEAATATGTAALIKQTAKSAFAATATGTANLVTTLLFFHTAAANVAATATLVTAITWAQLCAAVVAATATLTRQTNKIIAAVVSATAAIVKSTSKAYAATVAAVADLSTVFTPAGGGPGALSEYVRSVIDFVGDLIRPQADLMRIQRQEKDEELSEKYE